MPHVFTTGYLTHHPIKSFVDSLPSNLSSSVLLSRGMSVGLRMIPTVRDLKFLWEEMPQQVLDEQQQKVRESAHAALIQWAESMGRPTTTPIIFQCNACIQLVIGMKYRICC